MEGELTVKTADSSFVHDDDEGRMGQLVWSDFDCLSIDCAVLRGK